MQLSNFTPFAADQAVILDERGGELLVIAVKGTWQIQDGATELAEDQSPVLKKAVHGQGEPTKGLLYDSDLFGKKLGTDCLLVGHATSGDRKLRQMDVQFSVGDIGRRVRVFGDRVWEHGAKGLQPSQAEYIQRTPLVYERAFGGSEPEIEGEEQREYYAANPIGVGFRGDQSTRDMKGNVLPNLECPDHLIQTTEDRPIPACFAPIDYGWHPRLAFAGTYDETWQRQRSPLLPTDFDRRYFSCAPTGLRSDSPLIGDEPVIIEGVTANGRLGFSLPGVLPRIAVKMGFETETLPVQLETVLVEADKRQLVMTWKAEISLFNRMHEWLWTRIKWQ